MTKPGKVLGIRFCKVSEAGNAQKLADLLGPNGLGLSPTDMQAPEGIDSFLGAVFPVGDGVGNKDKALQNSWVEVWPTGEGMPEMVMLQIVVDNADNFAEFARKNGLDPKGPDDAHDERIYYLEGPGGLPIAFLSKV